LDNAQSESSNIKAGALLRLGHSLQQHLRVLCRQQLIEIELQRFPLGRESNRQHEGEPD